ncbi:IMP-specific 5'-nucleotidase 1 [Fusarium kuroshium]|uniref:IMP-specific 5'-nucleotidase 1 n=4 Tax=Fusarium solani species complex TaxID=232080 RepID=A0A3M2RR54_9HYPO|nr:IMP-specific 5'-nucleotidase 1 [Fusarium kuroshium]RSL58282.1 IMP-specific 5'-nucleotidase 1 [Fusarium floridanum]RSL94960.1 IMP-specific 5'-nucleotidase 1 [Fusarium oligoseptatum]RSL95047.1 IMP-specific 5'-nucleotidase 1 [Fusarium ambrosium]
MTTRYRVEYALKTHRRDQFIEWVKGLLAVPFVLYSQPTGVFGDGPSVAQMADESHRRYAEIMRDVELMIDDHIARQQDNNLLPSKLRMLVPTAGPFFTRLPLEAAFKYQDRKRYISSRRFVAPSFNDVRQILNSAQVMAVTNGALQLATFDGDVTLYDDGCSLEPSSPVIPRLLDLLRKNIKIGIVTAAGYTSADRYYERLHGLLDAIAESADLDPIQKQNIIIMGGEANYLFEFSPSSPYRLAPVPREEWLTPEMASWSDADITALLDVAESALRDCVKTMNLPAIIMRKDRAVGIIPKTPETRIARESLEETVLVVQRILELSSLGSTDERPAKPRPSSSPPLPPSVVSQSRRVPFCAFNGGRDVFVDIGDKSWGVTVCQQWFGSRENGGAIRGENTLHVGDQFLSAGSNDFKARSVGTTAWIASPAETVELLDELADLMQKKLS